MQDLTKYTATGRRKEAMAQVDMMPGNGVMVVNDRPWEQYFPTERLRLFIKQPLEATQTVNKFNLVAKLSGGGISAQAGALRHGISKALVLFDESLRPILRKGGFLTRDPRMKERKKYGQKGARKRFQWTKR